MHASMAASTDASVAAPRGAGTMFATGQVMLMTILLVVILLALVGSVPAWPHSRNWGYYPSGGLGLVLVVLLVLFLAGHMSF